MNNSPYATWMGAQATYRLELGRCGNANLDIFLQASIPVNHSSSGTQPPTAGDYDQLIIPAHQSVYGFDRLVIEWAAFHAADQFGIHMRDISSTPISEEQGQPSSLARLPSNSSLIQRILSNSDTGTWKLPPLPIEGYRTSRAYTDRCPAPRFLEWSLGNKANVK
ncbi:hypothetical protein B0O80DRAFT_495129 [Mortierella sp. GBAus27b]|nr:hypothetical protein B0O80DRAFT_495129 [Mortierella sp. GBAus27b]